MTRNKRPAAPPGPPPLERETVARLVAEIAERADEWHTTADGREALDLLCELVGSPMPGYYVMAAADHPDGPRPLDEMTDHIMEHAPTWAAQARRVRHED